MNENDSLIHGTAPADTLAPTSVESEAQTERSAARSGRYWLRVGGGVIGFGLFLAVLALVPRALRSQQMQSERALCQSNQRRVATALFVYAQDYDSCLPPPDHRRADGVWENWVDSIKPIDSQRGIAVCPTHTTAALQKARHPVSGYSYPYSYALNDRFFGTFSPGPFPMDNLELPGQTVLLVEAGPYRAAGNGNAQGPFYAVSAYTDTVGNAARYGSPHLARMNVITADGHASQIRIAHYTADGHDTLYGRLGGNIYNWNAGHPNGQTDSPPLE